MFDRELAAGSRGNLESIGCKVAIVQRDVELDREVARVTRTASPDSIDATPRFDCVVQGRLQAFRDESAS